MRVHLKLVKKNRGRGGGGGNIKSEEVELKPSTSQQVSKVDTGTLFDKIGQLFEIKMGCMLADLKSNIATNVRTLKTELKLDIKPLPMHFKRILLL